MAALLVEPLGSDHPGTIKSALGWTAEDLGERVVDPIYGHGQVNAAHAVGLE